MIASICHRSVSHNSCEDSLFYDDVDNKLFGGVFDGCSTGINSHFASQLLSYSFRNNRINYSYSEYIIVDNAMIQQVKVDLETVAGVVGITAMNLLATCVLFEYDKETLTLKVRVFGDGYYYVNGEQFEVDQDNTPDYLGYHLDDGTFTFREYLDKYPIMTYDNVTSFSICSDGIQSFKRSQLLDVAKHPDPLEFMLEPPISSNHLQRKFNMLAKDKWTLGDDLSIISYIQD